MGNNIGYSDEPAKRDTLGIDSYYDGFQKFIENCNTPLTMAIQGDWGSGKTTALKLIEKKIDPKKDDTETSYNQALADFKKTNEGRKCHVIWFNTWQYASFGLNDNLTLALFTHLNTELSKLSDESDKTFNNVFNNIIKPGIKTITKTAAEINSIGPIYEAGENLIHKLATLDNIHFVTETISKLKRSIQNTINTLVPDGKRLVIFIDDLDRLEPKVAVELLEGIKNLMDCEKCVFILAVDAQVIYQGVYSKYGDSCDEERARMFFDKIIQVPFYIPLQKYDTNNFLTQEFLKDVTDEAYRQKYLHAVTELIGNNPRSIKRVFNLWELNKCVEKIDDNPQSLYNLFVLLILQLKYSDLFKELIDIVSKSASREEAISILSTKILYPEGKATTPSQESKLLSSEKKVALPTIKNIFDLPKKSYDEASTESSELSKNKEELNEEEQNAIEELSNIIAQWEDLYTLLRNSNPSQAINSDINSLDLPENMLHLLQDINNTKHYTFDTTERTAISFYLNNKKVLSFSKQKDGTVNIVIKNIHNFSDFKERKGKKKYGFHILAKDTHLTIVKVGSDANMDMLKQLFKAYEISY